MRAGGAPDGRRTITRRRLDAELVRRGLASGRRQARELIEAGRVTVAGAPADKVHRLVDPAEPVHVAGPPERYVGRGGYKLEGALTGFALDPTGCRVLDVGASTGGFTDCLLQHGARQVVAVDVGRGQLHQRLRTDARVQVHERLHARDLSAHDLGGPFELVVADLSFISLRTVVTPLVGMAAPGADLVLLVKPQFEAGRADVGRGGVVREPTVWERALLGVHDALVGEGATIMGAMVSPLRGSDGNVEFFLRARRVRTGEAAVGLDDGVLSTLVAEVAGPVRSPQPEGR